MNFIRSLRRYCHSSNHSRTHGSIYRRQNGNITKSTKNVCRWKKKGTARTNYRWDNIELLVFSHYFVKNNSLILSYFYHLVYCRHFYLFMFHFTYFILIAFTIFPFIIFMFLYMLYLINIIKLYLYIYIINIFIYFYIYFIY